MTALHTACIRGHTDIAELLLDFFKAWHAQGKVSPKVWKRKDLLNKV